MTRAQGVQERSWEHQNWGEYLNSPKDGEAVFGEIQRETGQSQVKKGTKDTENFEVGKDFFFNLG